MSQSNFMRNVRMTLPQFITNVTSYNDTVRILKNKGIITEASDKEIQIKYNEMFGKNPQTTFADVAKALGISEDKVNAALGISKINMFEEDKNEEDEDDDDISIPSFLKTYNSNAYVDALKAAGDIEDEDYEGDMEDDEKDYDADYSEPNEPFGMAEAEDEAEDDEMAAILKQLEDEEDAKHTAPNIRALSEAKTKWENTSGKAMYDQFREIDNMNSYEVMIGINFEMEKNHELNKKEATKIVIRNLKKNPNYYTATYASGVEGYVIPSMSANPEAWQMKYLTKDNLVDKEMGMKPVKNVAKAKASANKAKKETNKAKDIDVLSLVAQTLRGVDKMQSQGEKMKTIKLRETIQRLVKEVLEEDENRYEYSGNSVDRGETGSSIEFNITKNEKEYYTVEYIIKPNSKYSSKSASRNNVRTPKTGTETIKKDKNARSEWITVRGDSFLIGKDFENKIFKEENK